MRACLCDIVGVREDGGDSIGDRVRALREKRGWSQAQLAQVAGLHVRTVRRTESGKNQSLATLQALAAAFDVEIADLKPDPRAPEARRAAAEGGAPSAPQVVIHATAASTHAWRLEHEDAMRASVLRQRLVNDMVGWRKQAIFAAALEVIGLDRMLLENFYIEPIVRFDSKSKGACGLIRELVSENAIVVVSAPYGHGKSP